MTSGANAAIARAASPPLSVAGCSTGSPSASARSLTGLAARWRPRPLGRSGCVNTATMRWRDAAMASSDGTAKSGRSGEDDRQAAVRGHGVRQIAGAREVSGARPSARSLRSFSSFLRTRWRFISER